MPDLMIQKDVSLRRFNTFGIDVRAAELAVVSTADGLHEILAGATRSPFVLGGGSNLLLTRDIDQLVLLNEIGGIEVVRESSNFVDVRIGGGVVWHDFVQWAVDRQLGGVENLALIPGKVGAAPIQNIGAYGVELTSVFRGLEAMQLETRERAIFDHAQCRFGYRDSIFKRELKGKYCITTVTLRLSRAPHMIEDSYGAIRQTLQDQGIGQPGIAQIFEAVVAIRSSKLPDPAVLGNSGSFFKNPVVPEAQWRSIKHEWPDLVYYPDREGFYKIPAGWLIDQCGWKGKRIGNVGCYEKQALVIVNYGSASGQEVLDHAMRVRASVKERFGIELTPEVNIL